MTTARARESSVSLIVLNWNGRQHLAYCLPSLLATDYPRYELIVVDNASTDDSPEFVRENFPNVRVIVNERNLGFSAGMNVGLRAAEGSILVLLNNDLEVHPGWLRALVDALAANERVGIAGCKVYYPDGRTLQHAGGIIHYPQALPDHWGYQKKDQGQYNQMREVDYVIGAALAVKREVLEQVGYLDEGYFLYYDDPDLSFSARKVGYSTIYVPDAVVFHHEAATNVSDSFFYFRHFHRSRLRFFLKHHTVRQFLEDFLPAERQWLQDVNRFAERRGLCWAYHQTLLSLHELPLNSDGGAMSENDERIEVARALEELRARVIERRLSLSEASSMGSDGPATRAKARDADPLANLWEVKERPFTSDKPIIGPLIVRLRELVNWMSTKWYVRALLAQQNSFNFRVLQRLAELETQVLDFDADRQGTALIRDVGELRAQLVALEQRMSSELSALSTRLERIEALLTASIDEEHATER
jgi:GT2 family glycosyltransferase